MNIIWFWKDKLKQVIGQWCKLHNLAEFTDWHKVQVNFTDRMIHGQVSTNVAMILARTYKKSPQFLYEEWLSQLQDLAEVETVSFVAPGFINFVLQGKFWHDNLRLIVQEGVKYGHTDQGRGERINVEFVSANPTGPLHLAHVRGAIVGDILANILTVCGYNVDREYYINDCGGQVTALTKSLYRRYGEILQKQGMIKSADSYIESEQEYPGEYLIEIAEELVKTDGDKHWKSDWDRDFFKRVALDNIIGHIKQDLRTLGINFDYFVSESSLHAGDLLPQAIDILQKQDLLYEGVIAKPKSSKFSDATGVQESGDDQNHDAEEIPQPAKRLLFKSTAFGDNQDRYLKKHDGSWTYFASDVAYHLHKINRGYKQLIFILGADHTGYVKRITSLTSPLSHNQATSQVYLCQLVKIIKDNVTLKLSKRQGNIITLRDLVQTLGVDATRLITISCKREVPIDIDLQKTQEQSMHNPVFYIQYAYARCHSVWQKLLALPTVKKRILSANVGDDADQQPWQFRQNIITLFDIDLSVLRGDSEMDLMIFMTRWPDVLQRAFHHAEPNIIVTYLQILASKFHTLWNQGKKCHVDRFVNEDNLALTMARLALVQGAAVVLHNGLHVLGVRARDVM